MLWRRLIEKISVALSWFSKHFETCNDRITLVKSWLPETSLPIPTWLGQLVYDRALQLVSLKFLGKWDVTEYMHSHVKLHPWNLWPTIPRLSNANRCTKSHYGAFTLYKTTLYKLEIPMLTKTKRLSYLVNSFFFLLIHNMMLTLRLLTGIEKTKKRLSSCRKKRLAHEAANGLNPEVLSTNEVRYHSPPWDTNNGSPRR